MVKVLATGVFNILHPGHVYFLEQAKGMGDELVVIVASDKMASKAKGTILPQEQRAHMISALKIVDEVYVGDDEDNMKLIPKIAPDIITLGFDQDINEDDIGAQIAKLKLAVNPQVVRLKKLDGTFVSSSKILKELGK